MGNHNDDVIKWNHFPRYWPFVRGIHRSPVNSPHKGQWRGVLMFSLICAWTNDWVNNHEAGDLRRHRTHYDVTVMSIDYCDQPHMRCDQKLAQTKYDAFAWSLYYQEFTWYNFVSGGRHVRGVDLPTAELQSEGRTEHRWRPVYDADDDYLQHDVCCSLGKNIWILW